ncbi:cobalamin biosynthesis protein CobW [Petralouisia muris]|uniref:Cobalamin biosynthesis protein CobW n=1 Tax=Petralouisia muris TaxID=3032872 RepID=A0AC61S0S4_9FIRM|nr:CobW family GTP-binding protein [Petralouisia muris]TGY98063.1 cobalamin biosynthesis protein CobW [Petralouisia muris]
MTKIDIISGFLGAGKTTFIKKMLEDVFQGEKIVLIENEFGEIGIDGGFLKDSGIEISELNSGCICCSLVGDFGKNLREVMERFHPDRILIEPSGVGKLSDVMKSVQEVEQENEVKLNGRITVVNTAKATKQMKAFGEFFNNQIEYATVVVLSRTQNVKPEQTELVVKAIREKNPDAAVITTPWDDIDGKQIYKVIEQQKSLEEELMEEHKKHHEEHGHCHEHGHHHEEHEHCHEHGHHHEEHEHCHEHHHHDHGPDCTCGCHDHDHHHHHHADEIFTSWGKETPHVFTKEVIEHAMKVFCDTEDYGTILRAKGMVPTEDGTWIYFDMVDGEYELRTGEADYTGRLCVIGTDIREEKLAELFGI